MARIIKNQAQAPFEIKPQKQAVWICMCGLSQNQPFCDGSHRKTLDEKEGKTYIYDNEGRRREVKKV